MDNVIPEASDSVNKLGQYQIAFGSNPRKIILAIIVFSVFLALLGFGTVAMVVSAINTNEFTILFLLILFLPFDVLCLAGIITATRRITWQTIIYSNGLLLHRNKKTENICWEDVKSYTETVNYTHGIRYDHQIVIHLYSGKRIEFDSTIKGVDIVGQKLREKCNPLILSRAVQSLNNNEPIEFGDLVVRPDGLEVTVRENAWKRSKKSISWIEVEDIEIEGNQCMGPVTYNYVIRQKGKKEPWDCRSVPLVPNTEVFFFIVKRILGKS
ncbi:MAG: hypothetical protein HYS12_13660 [Planctomycetes bacterium]|nr:hypothetical protein [Planctomycetota bacterium]